MSFASLENVPEEVYYLAFNKCSSINYVLFQIDPFLHRPVFRKKTFELFFLLMFF